MDAKRCNELALALQEYDFLKDYINGTKPFIDYPHPVQTEHVKVIGKLNFFEKALWSAYFENKTTVADKAYDILQYFVNFRLKRAKDAEILIRKGFTIVIFK
jgi:hypothetical protein